MPIPISFWGSPTLSADLLQNLVTDSRFEILFVVTQPDKPRSKRGQKLEPSPVKAKAINFSIPVLTPEELKLPETQNSINKIPVNFHVVLAYGKLIPKIIFNNPPQGSVNFHASLLPTSRGAAPIEFALWESHMKTGWSLQHIVSRLDAGGVLDKLTLDIDWEDHQYSLHEKMKQLLLESANNMLYYFSEGKLKEVPQDENAVTHCRKIKPIDGQIHWEKASMVIRNQARALDYKPGVFVMQHNKKIKIFFDFSVKKEIIMKNKYLQNAPGDLLIKEKSLWVICGDSLALPIKSLQISGKPKISATDFRNSYMRSGSMTNLSSCSLSL